MARPTPSLTPNARARPAAAAPAGAVPQADPDRVVASAREAVLAVGVGAPIQAMLEVGAVDDPLEAEADRMADAVVARIAAAPAGVARVEDEEPLQGSRVARAAMAVGPDGGAVAPDLEARLLAGAGAPLADDVRRPMEQAFGADFSAVRVAETAAATEIGARAYASGTDIRFAPGQYHPVSAAGQHLLAHELAHVVQQGGAGVKRDPAAVKELADGAPLPSSAADTVASTVGDVKTISEAKPVDLGTTDPSGTFGVTSLAAGITGLIKGFMDFYARMQDGSTEDKLVAAHDTLESMGSTVKGAIDIASTAGASIVGTVVPGIDLAYALLSGIRNAGQLVYLVRAKHEQADQLMGLQLGPTNPANIKLEHALENIQVHTAERIASTAIKLGADITMAVGAAAQLATGPFGTAVKLAGALVKASVSVGSALVQSIDAGRTADAREGYARAMESGTKQEKGMALLNRLDNDAAFALSEIITQASRPPDPKNPTTFDPKMLAILANYGIGESWLAAWVAGGRDAKKREEAENRALRFIGVERDPKTIGQRIVATFENVKKLFSSEPVAAALDPAAVTAEASQQTESAHSLKPFVPNATPSQVTTLLHAPVVEHLTKKYNPSGDSTLAATVAKAIDEGMKAALAHLVKWADPGSLTVAGGIVGFTNDL